MNKLAALQKYFHHQSFSGIQEQVIDHLLQGNHALVLMPTGAGKSICFQLPALLQDGTTLVISPLIALMNDQVEALKRKGISSSYINSSLSSLDRELRLQELLEGKYKLFYVTPERFRKKNFVDVISKIPINFLAVDEAHCISQWGHDFRPDYSRISEIRAHLKNPTTIACTATATPMVQEDIISQLGLTPSQVKCFHQGIDRPNLQLNVSDLYGEESKLNSMMDIISQYGGAGIIYFTLIKTLNRFSELLEKRKIPHLIYHGDLPKNIRHEMQLQFIRQESPLVLATNAFGMGIDKSNIRYIIHGEIPGSIEAYYQEIGRAGRDAENSAVFLLYDEQDLATQMEFLQWSNPSHEFYKKLHSLLLSDKTQIQSAGINYLEEKMINTKVKDYRVQTALGILERFEVLEGSINSYKIKSELPLHLRSQEYLKNKLLYDQKRLYQMLQYVKLKTCRKHFIAQYFGLPTDVRCNSCDNCLKESNC